MTDNANTDDYLRTVTIGERQPLNRPIELSAYDSSWPARFELIAQRIRDALGSQVVLLEHVGSTAVPRLTAKPVIDLVLAVPQTIDEASYVPPLERVGFVLRIREPEWFEHRMFKTPEFAGNLHVFSNGCPEIERMLLFRDWLRAHDDDRQLYESAKIELASRVWQDVQHYADAKSAVVQAILARAAM